MRHWNLRCCPRATWNDLFDTYQKVPGNFYRGFEKMGVLQFDVEQMQATAEAEGKPLDADEAARLVLFEVIDELGNDTWWQRAMALVEEDCRRDVAVHPGTMPAGSMRSTMSRKRAAGNPTGNRTAGSVGRNWR